MAVQFCSLASGSSGNSHLISNEEDFLLIDAGLSGKRIENKLKSLGIDSKKISGILVSHEHSDHILGVGILSRRYNIPIYANEGTWQGMASKIGEIKEENKRVFQTGKPFAVGGFTISPYQIFHDAQEPVGFSMECGEKKISITTDLGKIDQDIIDQIKNSDLVVLESNHDVEMLKAGKYPYALKRRVLSDYGHLSNEAAGNAIVELVKRNVKSILLAHLSKENNFPELAFATVKNILEDNNIVIGKDIHMDLAKREDISRIYRFGK